MKTPFQRTNEILDVLKKNFDGLEDETLKSMHPLVLALEETYETEFRAYIVAAKNGTAPETPQPPRPKRVSGYTVFGKWFRANNKDTVLSKDMFTVISGKWKALSKAEKDKWNAESNEVNKKEEANYVKEYGALPSSKPRLQKGPKASNPFSEFVKEFRGKATDGKHSLKQAAAAWKAMSADEKKVYVDRSAVIKTKNTEEFEALKKAHPELIDNGTGGKKKKKTMGQRPKRKTAYLLFGDKWRESLNKEKLAGKEAVTAIGAAWKKLSKTEQTKYKKQADKANVGIVEQFVKDHPEAPWTVKYNKEKNKDTTTTAAPAAVTASS